MDKKLLKNNIICIFGETQSGKTAKIKELCNFYTDNVLVCFRNITSDIVQFESRCQDLPTSRLPYKLVRKEKNVILTLANHVQLDTLYYFAKKCKNKCVLIVDEADSLIMGRKKTAKIFRKLFNICSTKVLISATCIPFFISLRNVSCKNIFPAGEKKKNYIGINEIPEENWHDINFKRLTFRDKFHSKWQPELEQICEQVFNRTVGFQVVLINVSNIKMFHYIIQDMIFSLYSNTEIEILVDNGTTMKGTCINKELKKLKAARRDRPKKIVIISGIKAGRGQSYKTEDKDEWYITDLIYAPSKTSVCDNIIQSVGRITGCFDQYMEVVSNLHIWTHENVKENIEKYSHIQQKIIETKNKEVLLHQTDIPEVPLFSRNKALVKLNKQIGWDKKLAGFQAPSKTLAYKFAKLRFGDKEFELIDNQSERIHDKNYIWQSNGKWFYGNNENYEYHRVLTSVH